MSVCACNGVKPLYLEPNMPASSSFVEEKKQVELSKDFVQG
jgi:hypothetical protein